MSEELLKAANDTAEWWEDTAAHWQRKAENTLASLKLVAGMLVMERKANLCQWPDECGCVEILTERQAHASTREELERVREALTKALDALEQTVCLSLPDVENAILEARAALEGREGSDGNLAL